MSPASAVVARHIQFARACSLAAVVLSLAACKPAGESSKPVIPQAVVGTDSIAFPKDSPQLATIKVAQAQPEQDSFVRINGRASWNDSKTSRVNSPVNGRIVDLPVMPGAQIRKGAVLAVVSSPEFGQIQAEARRAESDYKLAERTLLRVRELHGAGVVPTKELQIAEADFERARAEQTRTQVRERSYGGGTRVDQMFKIVSPIAGVVVDRRVTIGQEVRADQSADAPMFVISDPDFLWITLDVPEALTREIQIGEAVRITAPALGGEMFEANIEYIADFIDAQTRTVKARASVVNAARRLKADMYITAEVEVPASETLKVPANALYLQGDRYFAFVEESTGRFVRRSLRAEPSALGTMRVFSGLNKGDRLVVDGALLLQQMLNQKASSPAPKKGAGDGATSKPDPAAGTPRS